MGRPQKKKYAKVLIEGAFVPLLEKELKSPAFRELSGTASKLYLHMKGIARKVALKLGYDSDKAPAFDLTYTEAKRHGFSEKTFNRALKELWRYGFIDVVRIGGRLRSEHGGRVTSQYKLSRSWSTYGEVWSERTRFETDPWAGPSEPEAGDAARW